MPTDPPESASLLRQRFLAAAITALAEAIERQDRAEAQLVTAEHAIRERIAHATNPDAPDEVVEAFAAWLPEAHRCRARAEDAMDYAAAQAAQARTALALARTAAPPS